MANVKIKDFDAASALMKTSGDGSASAPHIAHHVLSTGACGVVGISGSPLVAQIEGTISASLSSGSVALLAGANVVGSASVIQSTPTGVGNAWPVKVTDGTDVAEIDSASRLTVAASAVVTNMVSASISSGSVALLAGANVIGSASVIQSTAAADTSPWPVKISDGVDTAGVDSASRLTVAASAVVTNTVSASLGAGTSVIGSASVLQSTPTGIANAWPVQITDLTDTAVVDSASRLTVAASAVVTNTVSASISSGSVALLAGANIVGSASVIQSTAGADTAPWPVKISDGTDIAVVDSASRLTVAASAVVTNTVSASISSGSVALLTGANVIGSASVLQSTPNSNANAWPVKITEGTNIYGASNSPLAVAPDNGNLWVSGSLLTMQTGDISASTSGCIIIVSGCQNKKIRVVAITYSTSGSQRIGWISGSSASTLLQSPMALAQFGGMDVNRMPAGYLWEAANGSALVATTTAASQVSGNLNWVYVPV